MIRLKFRVSETINNPLFSYILLPIFYILIGTILSLTYSNLNFLSFFLLTTFVLINQVIEVNLKASLNEKKMLKKTLILILEGLLLFNLTYFLIVHSVATFLLLLCYGILTQTVYFFKLYELDLFSISISTVLKALLLNTIGFYIHTGFFSLVLLRFFIPLLIPIFLAETSERNKAVKRSFEIQFMSIAYVLAIAMLWTNSTWLSLGMLLTVPALLLNPVKLTNLNKIILFFFDYAVILLLTYFFY